MIIIYVFLYSKRKHYPAFLQEIKVCHMLIFDHVFFSKLNPPPFHSFYVHCPYPLQSLPSNNLRSSLFQKQRNKPSPILYYILVIICFIFFITKASKIWSLFSVSIPSSLTSFSYPLKICCPLFIVTDFLLSLKGC